MLLQFIKLAGWTGLAQIIFVISAPLLTRIYSPYAYGQFGSVVSIASLYAVVAALRMDILGFRSNENDNAYKASGIIAIFISSFLLNMIIWVLDHYGIANQTASIKVLVVCVTAGIFNLVTQWAIIEKKYNKYSFARIWQVVFQVIIAIALGLKQNSDGLLVSYFVSQVIAILLLSKNNYIIFFDAKIINNGWFLLKNEWGFAIKNSLSSLMLYSTPLAPTLLLTIFFNKELAGYYFLCSQIFSAPLSVVRRALLNVFTAEFSDKNFTRQWVSRNKKSIVKIILLLFLFNLTIAVLLKIKGSSILIYAFGSEWIGASKISYLVFMLFIIDACFQPLTNLISIWGYENRNLIIEIIRFLFIVIIPYLILTFSFVSVKFEDYILYHCAVMILFYLFHALMTYRVLRIN